MSSPSEQNISLFQKRKSAVCFASSPPHQEGRIAIVTDVGRGCDGRGGAAGRTALTRTAKACGPDPPTLGSSCAKQVFRLTTVAIKARTPGRARDKP